MFAIAGGWVRSTPGPAAKLLLDRHAAHAAWRAAQWWDRMPVVADVDRSDLVVPPGPGWERSLADLEAMESTWDRLAGLYRVVLPALKERYDDLAAGLNPVSDPSVLWTLSMLAQTLEGDRSEGEEVLATLVDPGPAAAGLLRP